MVAEINQLNFPVIRGTILQSKTIGMDDYLRFIFFNLRYTVDRDACRHQKNALYVNSKFFIK